jgi:hypothetical protein
LSSKKSAIASKNQETPGDLSINIGDWDSE